MNADEQLDWERNGNDPRGIYRLEPCSATGHVPGCPGKAGGDHELEQGWIAYEENGHLIEVEVAS